MLRVGYGPLYIVAAGGPQDARVTTRCIRTGLDTGRSERHMSIEDRRPAVAQGGMAALLLAHRDQLIRFLEARGAGDMAEDLFQELWLRLSSTATGPVSQPLPYLYRAANNLMLDRYRSVQAAAKREQAWGEAVAPYSQPSSEQRLISREELAATDAAIDATGTRAASIFRQFRLEGRTQRDIATLMGVSLSTVEADLRKVYAALAALRRQSDA